jgi:hypothetical protein
MFLVWTCTWMSFTSCDLQGWFHTFASLPLVHTLNSDFWSDVFDLASSRTPKLLFMKTTALYDSRIKTSPDSRTLQIRLHQIPELCRFLIPRTSPVSNHSEIDNKFANRSHIRLLLSHIIRRLAWCMRFIRISSWMLPSCETEHSSPKMTYEFIHEFGRPDVSRV